MFSQDMKNSLVGIDQACKYIFSCASDGNKFFQHFSDVFPLFFLFTGMDKNPRNVSVVTEKRINPAAGAVPAEETVF